MSKDFEVFLIELPIIRRDFDKTNSAKFKGKIEIISNEYGIIKAWKITFDEVWIDLYTTPSWFKNHDSKFKLREELFKRINLKQEERPNTKTNKIQKLSEKQILDLNAFFNDRKIYNSTIKNIVGILKGNNPGGEAKYPDSAEMILNSPDEPNLKNFVILLDDLKSKKIENFDLYLISATKKTLNEFVNLNQSLKVAFDYMQQQKNQEDFSIYIKQIQNYCKKYNNYEVTGNEIANKERQKFGDNVLNHYLKSSIQLPFNFIISKNSDFQKCHIYEYHVLRDKIVKILYENTNANIEKYKNMISDPENFLPLPEEIHRRFDKYMFTYDLNGKIYPLTESGKEYVDNEIDDKFKSINESFMTKRKKWYFEQRNEAIIFDD